VNLEPSDGSWTGMTRFWLVTSGDQCWCRFVAADVSSSVCTDPVMCDVAVCSERALGSRERSCRGSVRHSRLLL
jgi:hypothetical protein